MQARAQFAFCRGGGHRHTRMLKGRRSPWVGGGGYLSHVQRPVTRMNTSAPPACERPNKTGYPYRTPHMPQRGEWGGERSGKECLLGWPWNLEGRTAGGQWTQRNKTKTLGGSVGEPSPLSAPCPASPGALTSANHFHTNAGGGRGRFTQARGRVDRQDKGSAAAKKFARTVATAAHSARLPRWGTFCTTSEDLRLHVKVRGLIINRVPLRLQTLDVTVAIHSSPCLDLLLTRDAATVHRSHHNGTLLST
jgi:hypothetical protein